MSSTLSNFTRGLDRAVLTAVVTVSLIELLKYIRNSRAEYGSIDHEPKKEENRLTAGSATPPREETHGGGRSGTGPLPVRGQRWYTYQTWYATTLQRPRRCLINQLLCGTCGSGIFHLWTGTTTELAQMASTAPPWISCGAMRSMSRGGFSLVETH